ncbi:MAG: lytic transglycosylase domain-containing protein [Gammaproteobacteria bacterium]
MSDTSSIKPRTLGPWPGLRSALVSGILLVLILWAHPLHALDIDPELRERMLTAVNDSSSFQDEYDAQVWLAAMLDRLGEDARGDHDRALHILRAAHREAARAKLPPGLVLAVMEVESRFDPFAWSHSGAVGLMQVMPFWLHELKLSDANLFEIDINLRMGCTILRYYLDMEKGNVDRALARYNGSLGKTVYPDKVNKALKRRWSDA